MNRIRDIATSSAEPAALLAGLLILVSIYGCGPERKGADFTYVARRGDTIRKVSARYFGDADLAERVAEHNAMAADAPLAGGTRLRIPYRAVKEAKADLTLMRRLNEARTLAARGDYAAAGTALEEVSKKIPEDPAAVYDLGLVSILAGDPKTAVEHLEKASVLAPGDPEVLQALATARLNTGDLEGAIAALQEALAADPGCDYVLYSLGTVYAVAGNYENARHYLFAYLLRDETGAPAERARRLLRKITEAELFTTETETPAATAGEE